MRRKSYLSGVEDIELAVKAIKLGAYDYLTKPLTGRNSLSLLIEP